jgi:hypothetical protein
MFTGFGTFSESIATATAKAPRIHFSLSHPASTAAATRLVLTRRPCSRGRFGCSIRTTLGKAKPPKQLVKSTITLTSFVHQPREAEGMRTSETCPWRIPNRL